MTDDELERQRARLRTVGWSDRDIDEILKRVPPQLLFSLRPLPPVIDAATGDVDAAVLRKVRALLAKAEATTFPDEAEAFSAKAQELMARHRIEHLDDVAGGPGGRRIWLDRPYADAKARLVSAVARANGCQSVWLKGLECVHLVGYPADLEATEVLFTSLLVQASRAAVAEGPQTDARGRSRTRSFRHAFLIGFAWRIGERLREATTAAVVGHDDLLPVLARRDDEVGAALEAAFPELGRGRHASVSNVGGWGAGVAAADRADVGRGRIRSDARGVISG